MTRYCMQLTRWGCTLVDRDRVLPPGKLPGSILNDLLDRYMTPDASVLIGPGVGRDAAAIAIGNTAMVVKTDPITFATADAGRYLVHVNANDIACMGATPRWLLVTALFPERSTTPRMVEEAFAVLATTARELGVLLVGGHSEITIGVDRLIQVGQMIGVCDLSELYDLRTAQPSDAILLANGIAIEGTAILATEARGHLNGLSDDLLERAAAFLSDPGISVLPASRALREDDVTVRGLHDPTEGGLATAVVESPARPDAHSAERQQRRNGQPLGCPSVRSVPTNPWSASRGTRRCSGSSPVG